MCRISTVGSCAGLINKFRTKVREWKVNDAADPSPRQRSNFPPPALQPGLGHPEVMCSSHIFDNALGVAPDREGALSFSTPRASPPFSPSRPASLPPLPPLRSGGGRSLSGSSSGKVGGGTLALRQFLR